MTETLYTYFWQNNPVRKKLKGRTCRVLKVGKMDTVLLEFPDTGERVTTSRRAIRRLKP